MAKRLEVNRRSSFLNVWMCGLPENPASAGEGRGLGRSSNLSRASIAGTRRAISGKGRRKS